MSKRQYDFDDEIAAENIEAAITAKKDKFAGQAVKLTLAEKRWLRKKRLATTKLKKITADKRRLRARVKAFNKTTKGN